MGLGDQLKQFSEKTKFDLGTVVRRTALSLGESMVKGSPVDTGRFRGAFVYGEGAQPTAQPDTPDKEGSPSLERIKVGVDGWRPGETIWIVNNLAYGPALEHGHSKQAPAGFVRISVANYQQYIADAIASVK